MKIKTSELTDAALDWAVDQALGATMSAEYWLYRYKFLEGERYSSDWKQGGPIIEREKIGVTFHDECDDWETPNWGAWPTQTDDRQEIMGETPLIAAMRCYVASELGDEVDVPEELV